MKSVAAVSCAVLSFAMPAAASAATKTVDMGLPVSAQTTFITKNGSDVNDFFPHGVTIHAGDSVKFMPVGFHNVEFPKKGAKPAPLLATGGPVSGSLDAAGSPFWFNGVAKQVGFNPAVALGSLGKTVTYTGAKTVQSGLPLTPKPKPMTVKFPKAGTYTYYCDVHTGMKGTVRVLAKAKRIPSAKADAATVAAQLARDLKIAKGLSKATLPANTVTVGNAGAHGVEYYSFLPNTLTVPAGTTVTFKMSPKTYEDHTATTGPGDAEHDPGSYLGKLAASFTTPPLIDPAAAYPSDPPNAPASLTPSSHGNGFWNSGVLDVVGASPLPASSSVKFSAPGTYRFVCLIHTFMHGTVVVT